MDKLKNKRKLRSGKETDKDEEAEEVKGSSGAPPTAKKVRGDDVTGAQKGKDGTSTEEEAEPGKTRSQEEDAVIERHAGGGAGQAASEGRVCSLCGFVAKTPTALKVHTKRKHFGEGVSTGKPELTRNIKQDGGSEKFETPETNITDLTEERVKVMDKEKQVITSNSSLHEGASPYQADSFKGEQLQSKSNAAEEQVENIPPSKCEEAGEDDSSKSERDVAGKDTLLADKRALGLQASMEDEGRVEELPEAEEKKVHVKTRAKRSNHGTSQSEDTSISPTQILLEMVETVTETESTSIDDSISLDNSHESDGDGKQEASIGVMDKGSTSEAAGCCAVIAQGNTDCQILDTAGHPAHSAQMELKAAEAVEKQGPSIRQKVVKRGPKPKTGHVLCDKHSIATHVKKVHVKEMNFSCQPCSYACVAKSDFEKHCSSNKHKTRVEGANALATGGAIDKLENASKTAAPVPSKDSDRVIALQLRPKAQSDRFRNRTRNDVASNGNEKTVSTGDEQEAKEGNLGDSFQECIEKSSSEDQLLDDDAERIKELDPGAKQSAGSDGVTESDVSGSVEIAERSNLKKRRGRPKGFTMTTCQYCGLVASNATNLSVHIRRRHSREYGFACKVCNYSCVTKGDMDRHCATKKHMKRMELASDSQSQDCEVDSISVVEVLHSKVLVTGDQHSVGGAVKSKCQEAASTKSTREGNPSQLHDELQAQMGDMESRLVDQEDTMQESTSPAEKKGKYDTINTCTYCGFVAHSLPSLELHVKRKHTLDFEFVCLACNYYAVTCREMSRHAATDKHRQKSQSYLGLIETNEGDATERDVSGEAGSQTNSGGQDVTLLRTPGMLGAASHVDRETDAETHPGQSSPNGDVAALCSVEETVNQSKHGTEANVEGEAVAGGDSVEEADVSQESILSEKDPEKVELKGHEGQTVPVLDLPSTEVSKGSIADPAPESAGDLRGEADSEMEDDGALEGSSDADPEIADGNGDSASKMLRALPFDASIVPFRTMFEGVASVTAKKKAPSQGRAATAASSLKKTKAPASSSGTAKGGGSARIRCDDCGFMADGLSGLNVHVSMKHPSKDKHFHCLLCGKSFYTESNLHQHLTSAAHLRNEQASIEELPEGGASFKCVKCSEPFVTEQDLFTHIKEKHEELLREVNKYVLEDTEQINREREENQGCVCKYCGKVCKSSNSMAFLAHVRTHTGSKPFKCKLCDFATAQLGDARNHVKRHLGVREYKCPVCGWAFVMKKHLNTHMLGKHGVGQPKERKFECELCDRSFSEKWSLNNHMKLHTGAKPYKCTWPACHYSFLTMSAMKDHYRTHTGEKSFLCDLCGFAGGTRHALTKHRRQHTGEKPFKCQLCSFASTTQSHLTRHRRVHTGEKPYHCPWCHYRSNCAENIRKHILHTGKHEGVKMYNCPKCEYGTNAPMDFRNHLKELHPDIENPDLAYLHAGIVSKSFECRLKGQGATFVKAEATFAAEEGSPEEAPQDGTEEPAVQQFIIIQGYGEDYAVDQALEQSAAATLQTLAMGGQVAEVLHITEDGQVIGGGTADAHQLAAGGAQFVLVESEEVGPVLGRPEGAGAPGGHAPETSSALDALLSAVTELGAAGRGRGGGAGGEAQGGAGALATKEERAKETRKEEEEVVEGVVQEVLQFAASQLMMKEGLTQVIVNDEGTHYIVTELDSSTLQVEGTVYTQSEASGGQEGEEGAEQALGGLVVYSEAPCQDAVMEE
ncbi:zinc finger protein 407 [Anguilla anguilla]|uniref:zinc finger protein 407 n=1 Tax=Anguilla anguilla TaxID=7936 RepID=UPI0015AAB6AB|nr:zinc finger protein 407 [Anguilla anguilla]